MKLRWFRRNLSGLAQWLHNEGSELQEGITALVRDCLPGPWYNATSNNLLIKRIRGGLSNSVFRVTLSKLNSKNLLNEPITVIMRFHETLNLDSVFDHMAETVAFMYLSERKFGPKLYSIFPEGRIEEYIDARPLTTQELVESKYSLAIAEKLALFHSYNPPLSRKRGIMFDVMGKWLQQIQKENFCWEANSSNTQRCVDFFKELDLKKEISWLRQLLEKMDSPVIFCHNDVQEGNILVTTESENCKKPKIILIDYEYCFYNYQAFDLANHFLEYTICYEPQDYPNFVVNEDNYPLQQHQLSFIRRYLTVRKNLQQIQSNEKDYETSLTHFLDTLSDNNDSRIEDITQEELRLLNQISKFRLASHLFWGIWAALRSQSHISFCYWEYCNARLKAYYQLKEELQD